MVKVKIEHSWFVTRIIFTRIIFKRLENKNHAIRLYYMAKIQILTIQKDWCFHTLKLLQGILKYFLESSWSPSLAKVIDLDSG